MCVCFLPIRLVVHIFNTLGGSPFVCFSEFCGWAIVFLVYGVWQLFFLLSTFDIPNIVYFCLITHRRRARTRLWPTLLILDQNGSGTITTTLRLLFFSDHIPSTRARAGHRFLPLATTRHVGTRGFAIRRVTARYRGSHPPRSGQTGWPLATQRGTKVGPTGSGDYQFFIRSIRVLFLYLQYYQHGGRRRFSQGYRSFQGGAHPGRWVMCLVLSLIPTYRCAAYRCLFFPFSCPPLFGGGFSFYVYRVFGYFSYSCQLRSGFPSGVDGCGTFRTIAFFSTRFFGLSHLSSSTRQNRSLQAPTETFQLYCRLFGYFLLSFIFFLACTKVVGGRVRPIGGG